MRNDNEKWDPALGQTRSKHSVAGFEMNLVRLKRQTLISGAYPNALKLVDVDSAIGWPDKASGESYALRLRRDRILMVNGPELVDGWHHGEGLAVSDMTDGYAVIEIKGDRAMEVLKRGTEIVLGEPSASVARGYGGYTTLIYAYETNDRSRLHVARGFREGLWAL